MLEGVRGLIRQWRTSLANLLAPSSVVQYYTQENPQTKELRARLSYVENLYETERRRNVKLNRMIHRRYGLTNAYGEHTESPRSPRESKPIPSGYTTLHQRRSAAEAQARSKILSEEDKRLKSNWGKKIADLEKETGLAEVISGDIRHSSDDSAIDLEFLRTE